MIQPSTLPNGIGAVLHTCGSAGAAMTVQIRYMDEISRTNGKKSRGYEEETGALKRKIRIREYSSTPNLYCTEKIKAC
jgi:hypothetical protein